MKSQALLYLLCLLYLHVDSQAQKSFKEAPIWSNKSCVIAYYGDNVTNPGLQLSFEYALINRVKSKLKRKTGLVKFKTHRLEIVPNMISYLDPMSHLGFIPQVTFQYKKINHHRWLTTFGVGAGLFINNLPNTYIVKGTKVSEARNQLTSYPSTNVQLGFARVKNKNGKMHGLQVGLSSQIVLNYNNFFQIAPALSIAHRL